MLTPSPDEFAAAAAALRGKVIRTPSVALAHDALAGALPAGARVTVKLELLQQAGSFKARGALLGIEGLAPAESRAGVVAASGGNHALAVSWAAHAAGVDAAIIMPRSADPIRIEGCRRLGARVTLVEDIGTAFDIMAKTAADEGRTVMHPFEARHMTLGAGTCGLELLEDAAECDMFILPVGGGGLISGMAAVIRQHRPDALIMGVEPEGADSMARSFDAGVPVRLDRVNTIADSLGSPYAMEYSFGVTRENTDGIVRVSDDALRQAMRHYYDVFRLVAEPACAASLAALLGPLRQQAEGRRVAIIACGSNISLERYRDLLGDMPLASTPST